MTPGTQSLRATAGATVARQSVLTLMLALVTLGLVVMALPVVLEEAMAVTRPVECEYFPYERDSSPWSNGQRDAANASLDNCDGHNHISDRYTNLSHSCNQTGHFARECPDKPEGGGLTGECYNCGEVGHNKADCTNPRVERPFSGTCNSCGQEGHAARNCPTNPMKCKLCDQEGHKALDCKSRRIVDWTGVPELEAEAAWTALIDAAKDKDLDIFRTCLRAYARATMDVFELPAVEAALREDGLGVYLIAKPQDIAVNMTIVDLVGNPDREYVLSIQLSDKPRRAKLAQGWPENAAQNLERLASAGFVQDKGVPLCGNCGELGHIRKVSLTILFSGLGRLTCFLALQAGASRARVHDTRHSMRLLSGGRPSCSRLPQGACEPICLQEL